MGVPSDTPLFDGCHDGPALPAGDGTGRCPHCGAALKLHRHGLSGPLVTALIRLFEHAGTRPVNLKELRLSRTQWDNFQKLRYWGLVAPEYAGGVRRRGVWRLSPLGRAFLARRAAVRKTAVTFRGEVVRFEGEEVFVDDVKGGYAVYEDYAAAATPL